MPNFWVQFRPFNNPIQVSIKDCTTAFDFIHYLKKELPCILGAIPLTSISISLAKDAPALGIYDATPPENTFETPFIIHVNDSEFPPTNSLKVVNPSRLLKELFNCDLETFEINFSTSCIQKEIHPDEEISNISPLVKFVCREEPAKIVYKALDDYLQWKEHPVGELEKRVPYVILGGARGTGKSTFSLRFLELEYSGRFQEIVNDLKMSQRHYSISCADFDVTKNVQTQCSLLLLFEAFKHVLKMEKKEFLERFYYFCNQEIYFHHVVNLINETFCSNTNLAVDKRVAVVNIRDTEYLIDEEQKKMRNNVMYVARSGATSSSALFILSGTDEYGLVKNLSVTGWWFVYIHLRLIDLDSVRAIILGMTGNPSNFKISPHLAYFLSLCGGVGKYLEIAIMKMSMLGSNKMNGTTPKGFKRSAYEYFLEHMQTLEDIENLLEQVIAGVSEYYPDAFSKYAQCIESLFCITILEQRVSYRHDINGVSFGELEKAGLVFRHSATRCSHVGVIPFIILYWAIKYKSDAIQIPFLKNIKNDISSEELEQHALYFLLAKLWAFLQWCKPPLNDKGFYAVMLSDILPIRYGTQRNININFRPLFKMRSCEDTKFKNYKKLGKRSHCMAFYKLKGGSFPSAVIYSRPMIGFQEINSKKRKIRETNHKRGEFSVQDILVMITDEKLDEASLGYTDVVFDKQKFMQCTGPLIALRKFLL